MKIEFALLLKFKQKGKLFLILRRFNDWFSKLQLRTYRDKFGGQNKTYWAVTQAICRIFAARFPQQPPAHILPYTLQNTEHKHLFELSELQKIVFPTLSADELMTEAHYGSHLRIFPEGQFVVLYQNEVVGATTTMRYDFDLGQIQHSFLEISGGLWLTTHQPAGGWLYGLDVSIHPAHQRKGLGSSLYQARQNLVATLGLQGQVTAGMPIGYAQHPHLSIAQYYELLRTNQLQDPTITPQIKVGFGISGLITNYLTDPRCGNAGILLTLPNPNFIQ